MKLVRIERDGKAIWGVLKGDEVLTVGGMAGRIVETSEQYIVIQISSVEGKPVTLTLQRAAVQTVLPKGTLKSL